MLGALVFAVGLLGLASAVRATTPRPAGCEAYREDHFFCAQLGGSCDRSRARMLCPITCDACDEENPVQYDWATCTSDQDAALTDTATGEGPFACHGQL